MNKFMVIALDGPDAAERRQANRSAHLERLQQGKDSGKIHVAGALLSDEGCMIGTYMVVQSDSRSELDVWLQDDPYVQGQVWADIQAYPCMIAPMFTAGVAS